VALDQEAQKALAARAAAALVENGQVIGLGSGTTVAYLLEALGTRVRDGLRCTGVPTSDETARCAAGLGIPLATLEDCPSLDLDIDGADEVNPRLDLIKGRGGALLREKIVASAARRLVVMVDETKLVRRLAERATLPVEIVPFGWSVTVAAIAALGAQVEIRGGSQPFHTDNGNLIADCRFAPLARPQTTATRLSAIPGVVGHGLFLNMTSLVLVGRADGRVDRLTPPQPRKHT
jgi:ribose 5-phosphate isomerase A